MILFNPHTEEVKFVRNGTTYAIAPGKKSVDFPEAIAKDFMSTFGFLETAEKKEEVKVEAKPTVAETKPEATVLAK